MTKRSQASRFGLAAFWVFAGVMHFVISKQYEATVPSALADWRKELVVASGVAEIAGGLAVIPDRTRRGARWWLFALLVAVFPANVNMAVNAEDFDQIPEAALWARLPFQAVFAWFTWHGTR